jgi:hypothetical protein
MMFALYLDVALAMGVSFARQSSLRDETIILTGIPGLERPG